MQRAHLVFRGRVQGVGFRAATCRTAEATGVVGWVRNAPDGTVECVAEGEEEALQLFQKTLLTEMSRYVFSHESLREPARGGFDSFEIRA